MNRIEERLRAYYGKPSGERKVSAKEKDAMQKTILMAELELNKKQKREQKGFGAFLFEQMRMTGMRIWIGQTGMVLAVFLLLYFMTGVEFRFFTPRRFAFLAGIFGIFLFSSAIPFLYRAKRYGMLEIEATARYSIERLLLARIFIISAGDLLMLFGIVWQISKSSSLTVWQTIFCLCLPFLLAFNGGIYLLRKVTFVHFQKWAYGMCMFLCGIFGGVTFVYPEFYQVKFTVFTGGIVIILAGSIIYQSFALFHEGKQCVYE